MEVVADPGPAEFADQAWDFLQRQPIANNILVTLVQTGERAAAPPGAESGYWLRAVEGGRMVGAAVVTPHRTDAVLSAMGDGAARVLAGYAARELPPLTAASGPDTVSGAFAAGYQQSSGTTARPGMAMATFRLDAVAHPSGVPGAMRPATARDLDLVADWLAAFSAEALPDEPPRDQRPGAERRLTDPESTWLWEVDGEPVSLVLRAVVRPGPGREGVALARISGVYTPPERRGHGYASAAVAAVSQRCLDAGCVATMLYTDLANPTSNKIYQDIGYRRVGAARTWLFGR